MAKKAKIETKEYNFSSEESDSENGGLSNDYGSEVAGVKSKSKSSDRRSSSASGHQSSMPSSSLG